MNDAGLIGPFEKTSIHHLKDSRPTSFSGVIADS
jgi:hypothetical protein